MVCFAFLFAGAMLVIGVVAGITVAVLGMNKLLDQDKQLQFCGECWQKDSRGERR